MPIIAAIFLFLLVCVVLYAGRICFELLLDLRAAAKRHDVQAEDLVQPIVLGTLLFYAVYGGYSMWWPLLIGGLA